jgi:hypothetical protein
VGGSLKVSTVLIDAELVQWPQEFSDVKVEQNITNWFCMMSFSAAGPFPTVSRSSRV